MSISYRQAVPGDASAVRDVFARSFVDAFGHLYRSEDLNDFLSERTPARFRSAIEEPENHFWLAFDGETLVGYVRLGPPDLPIETPPDTIQLDQMYVLKEWHGAGIAASLMDWAIAAAAEQGARHIQLTVYTDNHRARRFYERYGFHIVGRNDFMVGRQADEDLVLRHVILRAVG